MTAAHDHDIDGRLHDGCPMCTEIRSRMVKARLEARALSALDLHEAKAAKAPPVR